MMYLCASVLATFAFLATAQAADKMVLSGAGATFPAPLYMKWFSEYNKKNPNIEINYQSIGSGGGIKNLIAKTVDFGASDAPMTDQELKDAGAPVLHIPTVMGAVVITYNLKEVTKPLHLTGEVIADIYQGTITKWNDPKIAALNPGVALPATSIALAYRSDSSGTTAVFTEYLSKVSDSWKTKVGAGKAIKWPTGLGGKGNEGVTGFIKNTPGSMGYVEFTYAQSEKLATAELKNKAGQFVAPSVKSITDAATGALKVIPADFRVSITDADGKGAYPISAITYLLVYQNMDKQKGQTLVDFLKWAMKDGQTMAPAMNYAPLPKQLLSKVEGKVTTVTLK
jgi:phosphate transport system substrate-binding protein